MNTEAHTSQQPGVAETVKLGEIKYHYYASQLKVNPTGVVPIGPELDYNRPHDRGRFDPRLRSDLFDGVAEVFLVVEVDAQRALF